MKTPTNLSECPEFFKQLRETLYTEGSLEREELRAYLECMARLEKMPDKLRKRMTELLKKDYSDKVLCITSYKTQREDPVAYIHFGVDTDGVIYELVDENDELWTEEYPSNDAQDASRCIKADPSQYNAAELDAYEQYVREAPGLLQKRLAADKHEVNECRTDQELVRAAIIDGYNLNIIPEPYRDEKAVSYLSTFISTSQESFATALHHYGMQLATSTLGFKINVALNRARRIDDSVTQIAEREKELGEKVDHLEHELGEFEIRLMSMLDTISFRLNPNLYH